MKLEFREYESQKIVNIHKHVDGPWAWNKYSAHPYIGCRSGCEFCYLRGRRYLGKRDPHTFDTVIQVKINADALLRNELSSLERDVICCGDWQQLAEDRYQLSRRMLEAVCDLSFPLLIYERSPLVTRDLDLLTDINRQTWVGVCFSISTLNPHLKRVFEPRSPGVKRRLKAMAMLAKAGILVGAALMPIIPIVGDDAEQLDEVIRAVKDHGGTFVMGGGLTMDGVQAWRTLEAARQLHPALEAQYRELYHWKEGGKPAYGPPKAYRAWLGLLVRELCQRHNLSDRMPRYIAPGSLAVNKRVAERLFLKAYDLELEEADDYRLWAYRKAAWTVDELPKSVADIHQEQGINGLKELPGIGKSIAEKIVGWLQEANPRQIEEDFPA